MKKTKNMLDNFKAAYVKTAKFSVSPLAASIELINIPRGGDYDMSAAPRILGWFSLPLSAAATALTLPLGLIGMAGISGGAAVALSATALQDVLDPEKIPVEDPHSLAFTTDNDPEEMKNIQTDNAINWVRPSEECAESFPCQHSVTVKYKDGSEENFWMNGKDIAQLFGSYLKGETKDHFAVYADNKNNDTTSKVEMLLTSHSNSATQQNFSGKTHLAKSQSLDDLTQLDNTDVKNRMMDGRKSGSYLEGSIKNQFSIYATEKIQGEKSTELPVLTPAVFSKK